MTEDVLELPNLWRVYCCVSPGLRPSTFLGHPNEFLNDGEIKNQILHSKKHNDVGPYRPMVCVGL